MVTGPLDEATSLACCLSAAEASSQWQGISTDRCVLHCQSYSCCLLILAGLALLRQIQRYAVYLPCLTFCSTAACRLVKCKYVSDEDGYAAAPLPADMSEALQMLNIEAPDFATLQALL